LPITGVPGAGERSLFAMTLLAAAAVVRRLLFAR
jgi:hypothetical protein